MKRFALLLFSLLVMQTPAFAQEDDAVFRSEHTQVKLGTNAEIIQSGVPFKVFLEFDLADGWYTYGDPPGDAGLPVTVQWTLPSGFKAGKIEWPQAETFVDNGFTTYGYSGKTALPITITPPAHDVSGAITLKAAAQWLICNKICIPESGDLTLTMPPSVKKPE